MTAPYRGLGLLLVALADCSGDLPDVSRAPVGPPDASAGAKASPTPARLADISVLLLLDPRLTQSQYLGPVWVREATYVSPKPGGPVKVQVKATGVDTTGRAIEVPLEWTASDAQLVQISPASGPRVTLTVTGQGMAEVLVSSGEVVRTLAVRARRSLGNLVVEISQPPRPTAAVPTAPSP
ncbi:MAG: hypothetical protein ACOZIN_20205 [Myxococcota bacterium]